MIRIFSGARMALRLLPALATVLGLSLATLASGQEVYPTRPITIVVPVGAGGSTDSLARALAEHMGRKLGQPVVIENRPGAGATLGAAQMVSTKPDGYTLTMVPLGVFRMPYLSKVQYDPMKDLTYIASVSNFTYAIAVPAESKWKDLAQLIADVKASPDRFSYAGSALYTSNHLLMAELGRVAGLKWTFVPYKGDAEAITALLGGHVQIVSATTTVLPFVESGKVRVLAVGGAEPSPYFPGVPTLKQLGHNVEMLSPLGIGGPAGLPAAVVTKLDRTIREIVEDPAFAKQANQLGMELAYRDHRAYTAWTQATFVAEKTIIKRLAGE